MPDRVKVRRILLIGLTLLWMIFIFSMSSAEDDSSKAQSGRICDMICRVFVEGYDELPPARQELLRQKISFPVRKGAHLSEYAVLGALLALSILDIYDMRMALPLGFLYAVSDEIHQVFVPGRAGQVRDVLIDTAGVFIGILIIRLLRRRLHRKRV